MGTISITLLAIKLFPSISKKLTKITGLIKKYWFNVAIIFMLSLLGHLLNRFYSPLGASNVDFLGNLINFYAGFWFAAYTGSIAFKEYQSNQGDKLITKAKDYWIKDEYRESEKLYREAFAIKPDDIDTVLDMAELGLVSDNDRLYNQMIENLRFMKPQGSKKIAFQYLLIARPLLEEDNGTAKARIRELIEILKESPENLDKLTWGFKELKRCKKFKNLTGDSKKIFADLIKLLEHEMTPEEKEEFFKEFEN